MSKKSKKSESKAITTMGRQGDVLFIRTPTKPEGTEIKKTRGTIVLASGSSSSHQHVVRGALRAYQLADGLIHIDAAEDVTVTVEGPASPASAPRHEPITLSAGQWIVRHPMEWTAEMARRAAD